jgi:hypothetical protein
MDTDFYVKDDFTVGKDRLDVLISNDNKSTRSIYKIDHRNPVMVFNDKNIRIRNYKYVPYATYDINANETIKISHRMKSLPPKTLIRMPVRKDYSFVPDLDNSKASKLSTEDSKRENRLTMTRSSRKSQMKRTTNAAFISAKDSIVNEADLRRFKKVANFNRLLHSKVETLNFKTFNKYFENDEKIYNSIKEYTTVGFVDKLAGPTHNFDIRDEYGKIRVYDLETNIVKHNTWSTSDVLIYDTNDSDKYKEWNKQMKHLENINIILWKKGLCKLILQLFKYTLYSISTSFYFEYLSYLLLF